MDLSFNVLFAGIFFGMVGFAGLKIARNVGSFRMALISVALIAYPYFFQNSFLLWGTGILLTAALIIWRE